MSTLFSQIPAGAVLDAIRDQRPTVLPGMTGVGLAALLLCLTAARAAVYAALTMQGAGKFIDRTRHHGDQHAAGRASGTK